MLPVGLNLQDHPVVPIKVFLKDKNALFDPKLDLNEMTVKEYLEHGSGTTMNKIKSFNWPGLTNTVKPVIMNYRSTHEHKSLDWSRICRV